MVSLILPETSTAMMNLFLEYVSRSFPEHFIVMQVDQAGWHRSQELFIPANIRLILQPAYSPEVNPVKSGPLSRSPLLTSRHARCRYTKSVLSHLCSCNVAQTSNTTLAIHKGD
jgi:hypothetical protein